MTALSGELRSHSNRKRQAQIGHFLRRAEQRLGFRWSEQDHKRIVALVLETGVLVYEQSNRVWWYRVKYQEREFIAVYDRLRAACVTVLPVGTQPGQWELFLDCS